ncbi:beta-N-acetylhexosaminidase [Labilibaculum sp.]|uniref:beta-N-acetylhexosaminidase n=1 Tax=Labilibaculum sp. TaxID=2060723 RepID=UPI003564EB36
MSIIPKPVDLQRTETSFLINEKTTLSVGNELKTHTNFLLQEIEKCTSLQLTVTDAPTENFIVFLIDNNLKADNYHLNITNTHIKIEAGNYGGAVYALQSLKQLIKINNLEQTKSFIVPGLSIKDGPEFGWRGYMLDVSRHFHSVKEIKEVLDFMSELKLNRFHWHLSDDQGFRLEMKKFPKLNQIGSWRVDRNTTDENINAVWGRLPQQEGEVASYGGFYTREQVKELIAYGQERNIEILPEIDVPGHSQAIIASYPELACEKKKYYVATGAVRENNTLCPSNAYTYEFMQAVISEVAELFPIGYIHIGGDECNKSNWKKHAQCQNFIKKHNLKDEHGLQSYFIHELEKIVNANGKELIGWDEILDGGLAPNATVMSWRGEKGGIESAKMGHDVIMSPSSYQYLDFKQGQSDFEPNLGYAQTLLSKCYSYKVIPDTLTQQEAKYILGTQANLWSESISDWGKLTYMTFPRLFAVAENAWTSQKNKNWDNFTERLKPQFKVMEKQGLRFAKSVFNPWLHHQGNGKSIKIWFTSEISNPEIRYTLDGSEPSAKSNLFSDTLTIEKTAIVKAALFENDSRLGDVIEKEFFVHKAAGVPVKIVSETDETKSKINLNALTDLCYGQLLERGDTCWQRFDNTVEFELSFDKPTDIESVTIRSLRHTLQTLYAAYRIEVSVKDTDGFKQVGDSGYLNENIIQGRNLFSNTVNCPTKGVTILRVKVIKVKEIPENHVNEGKQAFMKLDEIIVL